ncbi:magnesium and cobalt transport protein CorA [Agrococcus sp. ARC_14]|uniref:magnesium and cobalt transport protein CorA n=1 Tax=Agrococcus sp. ARC_14 TaxID=2919927 RepID=UPI001F05C6CE|nr:magnesium and cobalt transport protein CorA [Agrococcus sp. ARC_14]MCH1882497.1 magnesium and cobalt transport protein CorA [Agrococcus sp. ARC_14]
MPIADASVWAGGARVVEDVAFDRVFETASERGGFAWIDLVEPSEQELRAVADELDLHHLVVEDVVARGQRTKLETYGALDYCVVHRVLHRGDELVDREVHAIVTDRCIVTISWGGRRGLARVRDRVRAGMGALEATPQTVLYAVLDEAADELDVLAREVHEQIEGVEDVFFGQEHPPTVDIYRAMRRVLALQRAAEPMSAVVGRMAERIGEEHLELRRHLRDVDDHARRTAARLAGDRDLLASMLQLASARVAERQNDEMRAITEQQILQNEQMKKITSWAAIIFAPTLIAGIYGMNFTHMPELHWLLGYPFAVALMVVFAGGLFLAFKRRHWL